MHDVVIYCKETRVVDTVAGAAMTYHKEHGECATRRLATVLPRLNDRYDAAIVDAGKYEKGDKLPKSVLDCNDWSESKAAMKLKD